MRRTYKYPSLHRLEERSLLLVTVAEGKGTPDDPVTELTYVCQKYSDGTCSVIGELYQAETDEK